MDTVLEAGGVASIGSLEPGTHVELVVIERHKKRVAAVDLRPGKTTTVADAVSGPDGTASFSVPRDLPPAYDGDSLGFRYELRSEPPFGERATTHVNIVGGPLDPPGSSPPLHYSKLTGPLGVRHTRDDGVAIGAMCAVAAVGLVVLGAFAIDRSDTPMLVLFGLVCLAFAGIAVSGLSVLWSRGRALDGISLRVEPAPVAIGGVVCVELCPSPTAPTEISLVCVEVVDASYVTGGTRRNAARVETVFEDRRSYDGAPVEFEVRAEEQLPFSGRGIGVHWLVRARLQATASGSGGQLVDVVASTASA